MSNLAELRAEVRDLIGAGAFDRLFKPEWADEGINWACDEASTLLGLTRNDSQCTVINKQVVIPGDAVKVVSVQIVG